MIGSLDNPPVVIVAKRVAHPLRLLLSAAVTVTAGVVSVAVLRYLTQPGHTDDAFFLSAIGVSWSLLSAFGLVVVIWRLVRPARVTLSPTGVVHRYLWNTRLWRWDEISGFRKVRYRGADWVGFDVAIPVAFNRLRKETGADQALLNNRVVGDIDGLVKLFADARERWKTAGAVDDVKTAPPAPVRRSLAWRLIFGRIGPFAYWICIAATLVLIFADLKLVAFYRDHAPVWTSLVILAIAALLAISAMRARSRDLGLGYWQGPLVFACALIAGGAVGLALSSVKWMVFIPIGAVSAAALALGFIPGQAETNRFGGVP